LQQLLLWVVVAGAHITVMALLEDAVVVAELLQLVLAATVAPVLPIKGTQAVTVLRMYQATITQAVAVVVQVVLVQMRPTQLLLEEVAPV
jgi:hypothetical protein